MLCDSWKKDPPTRKEKATVEVDVDVEVVSGQDKSRPGHLESADVRQQQDRDGRSNVNVDKGICERRFTATFGHRRVRRRGQTSLVQRGEEVPLVEL